jgi:sec-independent protein translocase protein TatA
MLSSVIATIGWSEITWLLIIALIVFGASRLPNIARSLGRSIREFKKGMTEDDTKEPTDVNKKTPSG